MSETPQPTFTVERKPESTVTVKAEVPVERVEEAADRAFRRLVRKVSIPGFRPGKAPRALYERTYGSQHIYEEAARDLVEEVFRRAVEDAQLSPLDSPDVEISRLGPQQPLVFEATVPVRPQIELGDYTAHGQKVEPKPVTDEDVERVLAGMREQHATLSPVSRPAQAADVLTVDVDVTLGGKELPPMGRNAHLELGKEYAIPGLADGLVGAAEGEERQLELAFPEDHPDPDLRGKEGQFRVKVHQVAEKVLPALDDEFAKTVRVADLAALKRAIRDELAHTAFHEARDQAAEKAVAHAVDTATLEIPAILVEDELDHMLSDLKQRLARQGLSHEEFLLRAKKTEADIRADWRDAAKRRAATLLVIDEMAKRESITVSNEELARELALVPIDPKRADELRSPRVLAAIARSIRNRKVIDRLVGVEGPDVERELLRQAGALAEEQSPAEQTAEEGTPTRP